MNNEIDNLIERFRNEPGHSPSEELLLQIVLLLYETVKQNKATISKLRYRFYDLSSGK